MSSTIEFNALGNTPMPAVYDGSMSVSFTEPSGSPLPSNREVDSSKPFDIQVTWSQSGALAQILGSAGGTYTVEVIYDRIGGQWYQEGQLPAAMNPSTVPAVDGDTSYSTSFTVNAGALPAGLYTLAVLVTGSASSLRLAGFEEIKPFRVY